MVGKRKTWKISRIHWTGRKKKYTNNLPDTEITNFAIGLRRSCDWTPANETLPRGWCAPATCSPAFCTVPDTIWADYHAVGPGPSRRTRPDRAAAENSRASGTTAAEFRIRGRAGRYRLRNRRCWCGGRKHRPGSKKSKTIRSDVAWSCRTFGTC